MTGKTTDPGFLKYFSEQVRSHGFFTWGAAPAEKIEESEKWLNYLSSGYHAGMRYLEKNLEKRLDPGVLFPGTKTVLVFLRAYANRPAPVPRGHARVALYAHGPDYHKSIARDLRKITKFLNGYRSRPFADTGPVAEKYWARRARVASLGKNGLCIRHDAGSRFFVGIILTEALFPEIGGKEDSWDPCAGCELCLHSCPTGALVSPYVVDANRCLSYLTVENRGAIPERLQSKLGDMVFGCETCQHVCPYNRDIQVPGHPDFKPAPPFSTPNITDLLAFEENTFRALASNSPLERASHFAIQRNALIAALNTGQKELLKRFLESPPSAGLAALAERLLKHSSGS